MGEKLNPSIASRIIAARYIFQLAVDQSEKEQATAVFASISLLQDALEAFLLSAAAHLNASISGKTEFSQYIDKINERLPDGVELPYRIRLIQINKSRVAAKHDGVRPDRLELASFIDDSRKFLEKASAIVFEVDFFSLSLVDILDEGESKEILKCAEDFLRDGEWKECLAECRKAIFIEFESYYDVSRFRDSDSGFGILGAFCHAPYYAKSKSYIDENVNCPFDYIVLDHARVDADLTKYRIDHGGWWNVWRLTPSVYKVDDVWMVKNEPKITESDGLRERAQYVFETSVEAVRKKQTWGKSLKWVRDQTNYVVHPKPGACVFKKASRESEVVSTIPNDLSEVSVSYGTPALVGQGYFWSVSHFGSEEGNGKLIYGYLDFEDTFQDS